jgi:hypothetical protein
MSCDAHCAHVRLNGQLLPTSMWGRQVITPPMDETAVLGRLQLVLADPSPDAAVVVHAYCFEYLSGLESTLSRTFSPNTLMTTDIVVTPSQVCEVSSDVPIAASLVFFSKANLAATSFIIAPYQEHFGPRWTTVGLGGMVNSLATVIAQSEDALQVALNGIDVSSAFRAVGTTVLSVAHIPIDTSGSVISIRRPDAPGARISVFVTGQSANSSGVFYAGGARLPVILPCLPTPAALPRNGVDDDCDGWIDEEIANGIDDDNDDLIDEDLATAPPLMLPISNVTVIDCGLTGPDAVGLPQVILDPFECSGPEGLIWDDLTFPEGEECPDYAVLVRTFSAVDSCGGQSTLQQHLFTSGE